MEGHVCKAPSKVDRETQTHAHGTPSTGTWDRSQVSQDLPVSSMKTSALTYGEELRAAQSQPLHLFFFFFFFPTTPLTQALPRGVMLHLPFTQETRVEPGHWLTEAEHISSRALAPKKQKFLHMHRLAQPQVHPLKTRS